MIFVAAVQEPFSIYFICGDGCKRAKVSVLPCNAIQDIVRTAVGELYDDVNKIEVAKFEQERSGRRTA